MLKLWSHHCTFCLLLKLLCSHSTGYATQYNYYRIHGRTNYGKFSLKLFASKLCESIPMSLKLLPPNSFRAHYKLHLLSGLKWTIMEWHSLKITWEPDLPILFDHYWNQLKSLSSSGCCALTDNVSLLVFTNMFIFFFCLNNVQYIIYGNSANKQWIESVQCTFHVFNRGRLNYS